MSTCSQFPPSPQEKNVGKGQGSGGNVTSLVVPVPTVNCGDLFNAVIYLKQEVVWRRTHNRDDISSGFWQSFEGCEPSALIERARVFFIFTAAPEFAVYDLAFELQSKRYKWSLLNAAAVMPLTWGETPSSGDVAQVIDDLGLTYRSEA